MSQSTYDSVKNECRKISNDSNRSAFGKLDATIKKAATEDRILIPCLVNKQEDAYSVVSKRNISLFPTLTHSNS